MSVPPSPDHLPAMPAHLPFLPGPNDPYLEALDYDDEEEPYEDLADEYEEDSDDDPEMDIDIEEVEEPMVVRPLSPLTSPPPISPNSSESNHITPTQGPKSTYEVGGSSIIPPIFLNSAQYELYCLKQSLDLTQHKVQNMARQMNDQKSKVTLAKMEAVNAREDLDLFKLDMSYARKNLTHVEEIVLDPLTGLEDVKDRLTRVERAQDQDAAQIHELRNRLTTTEIRLDVANFDRYHLRNEMYGMQSQMYAIQQRLYQKNVKENRPNDSVDVLATYGYNEPSGLQQTLQPMLD